MEFVLVDDSVVTAFAERSSRMLDNVHRLQDKMSGIFNGTPVEFERDTNQNTVVQSESIGYTEQNENQVMDSEISLEVDQMMNDIDFGSQENYSQTEQSIHVENDISNDFDDFDNFDLDLDAMLDGISLDGNELEL